jgi:hypothetical protein
LSVAAHLGQLKELPALDEQLRPYLLYAPHRVYGYPLSKVLVSLAILDGGMPDLKKIELQEALLDLLDDEVYRALIAANPSRPSPPPSRHAPVTQSERTL